MTEQLEQAAIAVGVVIGGAIIWTAVSKLLDFLGNFFLTTKQYNKDKEVEQKAKMDEQKQCETSRSQCRKDIYEEIKKKADTTEVNFKFETLSSQINNLNNQQLHLIEGQAKVSAQLEMLITLQSQGGTNANQNHNS